MQLSSDQRSRLRGCLFGQAVGDALGLATEFMSRDTVRARYPRGVRRYSDIIQDRHRRRWRAGEWTDDTEQALCLLESYLAKGQLDEADFATRLYHWMMQGGMGIGATVESVLKHPRFLLEPSHAAREVWEHGGRRAAANGGIMRTAPAGLVNWMDPHAAERDARRACEVTHADPRCVGSSVLVSLAIAWLVEGADALVLKERLVAKANAMDERILAFVGRALEGDLDSLELDDEESMGYTLKALGAALWALFHASDFESGVIAIIEHGGDADTNAAVAGAVLGARDGEDSIPGAWVHELRWREYMDRMAAELIKFLESQDSQADGPARTPNHQSTNP